MDGLLYGVVCWFAVGYLHGIEPDADNISKGVWDILCDPKTGDATRRHRLGAFADDKQIRVRVAGIFNLQPESPDAPALSDLDLDNLPKSVVQQLAAMVSGTASAKHLTYVRFGRLNAAAYNLSPLEGAP